MRRSIALVAVILFLGLVSLTSAQQTGVPGGGAMRGANGNVGAKPSFAAMTTRVPTPTPFSFNLDHLFPTMPSFQNSMLMRNVFGSQMTVKTTKVPLPPQATPPPKK